MPKAHSRSVWITGTLLASVAFGNWSVPLAAWLFPAILLRYVRVNKPSSGILRVLSALLISTTVWLLTTGLVGAPKAILAMLFLTALHTIPFALDRVYAHRLGSLMGTLIFPLSRSASEYLFVVIAGFGTWNTLGGTQHANLPLIQIASATGVYGVSFLVAWFASVLNLAWEQDWHWPRFRKAALVYSSVLFVALGAGCVRLLFFAPSSNTVRVAGVGPLRSAESTSKEVLRQLGVRYWDPREIASSDPVRVSHAFAILNDDLILATRREARAGSKIILWPETQAKLLQEDLNGLVERVKRIAGDEGVFVNMAFALYTPEGGIRNIAMLVSPRGEVKWTYDKAHPTPMELMKPGPGVVPTLMTPYGTVANVICYDADFPDLMRQASQKRADLVLIPADDWFGFERIHAGNTVLRAVEQGYSIVRQSSHGVSSAIDPHGRVLSSIDYFTTSDPTMVAGVPIRSRVVTIYSLYGDVFAYVCVAFTAMLTCRAALLSEKTRSQVAPT